MAGRSPEVSLPFAVNFCGAMTGWGEHDLFTKREAILRGGYPKIGSGQPGWDACLIFGLIEEAPRQKGRAQKYTRTRTGDVLINYGPNGAAAAGEEEAAATRRAWDRVPEFEEIRIRMGRDQVPPSAEIRAALRELYPRLRNHTVHRVSVAYHDSLAYLSGFPNSYKIVPAPLAGLPQYGERPARKRAEEVAAPRPGTPGPGPLPEWRGHFPMIDLEAAIELVAVLLSHFGRREFRLASALGSGISPGGAASADHFYACCEYGLLEIRVGQGEGVHMKVSDAGASLCGPPAAGVDVPYAVALAATRPGSFKVLLAHFRAAAPEPADVRRVLSAFLTVDAERRVPLAALAFLRTMGFASGTGYPWEQLSCLAGISPSSGAGLAGQNRGAKPDDGEPWRNLGFVLTVDEDAPALELRPPGARRGAPVRLTERHQIEALIRQLEAAKRKVGWSEGERPRVSGAQPRRMGGPAVPPRRVLKMPTRRI